MKVIGKNYVVDLGVVLPFFGPTDVISVGLKSPRGIVTCPGGVEGCCGLRQGPTGILYCGRTGDQQAAGDIARCHDEITRIIQETPPQSAHPETSEG